jgi:hypothetical protein
MDLVADSVIGEDPETCQNQQKVSPITAINRHLLKISVKISRTPFVRKS